MKSKILIIFERMKVSFLKKKPDYLAALDYYEDAYNIYEGIGDKLLAADLLVKSAKCLEHVNFKLMKIGRR